MNSPEVESISERLRFPYNFIDAFFANTNSYSEPECSVELPLEKITDEAELSQTIETMLSQFPEDYKQAILLYYRDGLKKKEIQDKLGLSWSSLNSRLSKPIRDLRRNPDSKILLTYGQKGLAYLHSLSEEDRVTMTSGKMITTDQDL